MKAVIKQYIQNQLATNPAWAVKALVKLYTYQTANEQSAGHTEEHNGVGFSGVDSTILSSLAVQINHGRNLSVKQMAIVYKRCLVTGSKSLDLFPLKKWRKSKRRCLPPRRLVPDTAPKKAKKKSKKSAS